MLIVSQDVTEATNKLSLFEVFGVDNTPQKARFTASGIRCAVACLVSARCQGFSFASQIDDTDMNCFMYDWLTPGGGDVGAFATRSYGNTTIALILGEHVQFSYKHSKLCSYNAF